MKKQLKSQLIAAIAMAIIAIVALSSATYAWFTSIANPQVSTINLEVRAADNLMLSAYKPSVTPQVNLVADWKSSIAQTDISGAWGGQNTAFPPQMLNVSSIFSTTSSDFYISNHNGQGAITGYTNITASQPTYYAKFSLWVKSSKAADSQALAIDNASVVNSILALDNATAADAPKYNIKDTVRIGFVPVTWDGTNEVEDWDHAVVWEPNPTEHVAQQYGYPSPSPAPESDGKILTSAAVKDASTTATQVTNIFKTGVNKIKVLDIPASDTAYNFNVYIWVEGSDPDTVDAVAKSFFSTKLQFALLNP